MREFSKFRVITAGFILMFIFVIPAMYSNTKDITMQKTKNNPKTQIENDAPFKNNSFEQNTDGSYEGDDILLARIEQLEREYRQIHQDIAQINNSKLNCHIRGILDNDEVVPLSPEDAIEESIDTNRQIVITCDVK